MTKRTAHAELVDRLGNDEADRLTQMFLEDLMTKREAAAELGMSLSVFEYRLSQGDTKHARLMSESVKPHGQPRWVVVREPIPGNSATRNLSSSDTVNGVWSGFVVRPRSNIYAGQT